jgi:hypothetical protein
MSKEKETRATSLRGGIIVVFLRWYKDFFVSNLIEIDIGLEARFLL